MQIFFKELFFCKLTKKVFFTFLFFVFAFGFLSFLNIQNNTSVAQAAQVPAVITYQGKLLVNNLAATTSLDMVLSLYTASSGGTLVYTASGTLVTPLALSVTPVNGIFTVNLGGSGTNSLEPSIFQNNQNLYLQVTIQGETLSPRKQVTAAPYAFNSQYLNGFAATSTPSSSAYIPVADNAGNFNFNNVTSTGVIVRPTSSTAIPLSVLDSTGQQLLRAASSSVETLDTNGRPETYSGGFGILDIGSNTGLRGGIRLNGRGAGIIFSDTTGTIAKYAYDEIILTNGDRNGTSTYGYQSIALYRSPGNNDGIFTVDYFGNVSASGTARVYGQSTFATTTITKLGVGTNSLQALATIQALSPNDTILRLNDVNGNPVLQFASSTENVTDPDGGISEAVGLSTLSVGVQGSSAGLLKINNDGAVVIIDSSANVGSQLGASYLTLSINNTNTTTYANDSIIFNRSASNRGGVFTLDSSGNISASGTLKVYGTATLATTTITHLSVGTTTLDAQLTVVASSTNAIPFAVYNADGSLLAKISSSTEYIFMGSDMQATPIGGIATLSLGETGGSMPGGLALRNDGALTITNEQGLPVAELTSGSLILSNNGSNTSTYGKTTITLNRTSQNPGGIFTVDTVGNISASGTLRIYGDSILSTVTMDTSTIANAIITSSTITTANVTNLNVAASSSFTAIGIGTTTPITQLHVAGKVPGSHAGFVTTSLAPNSIALESRFAFVMTSGTSQSAVEIYDITTSTPILVASTTSNNFTTGSVVRTQGRYLYIGGNNGIFSVYDTINMSAPKGTITFTNIGDFVVSGKYAYVLDVSESLLKVVDISNAGRPTLVGSIAISAGSQGIEISRNSVYVVGGSSLRIFDISDPKNPTQLANSGTSGLTPVDVAVQDGYAYILDQNANELRVVDVTNLSSPELVGTADINLFGFGNPGKIVVQGRYAYLTTISNAQLQVFDISNPYRPFRVGYVYAGTDLAEFAVSGRFAYVLSRGESVLRVFDLGGAYVQQFEAGGIESGYLTLRNNLSAVGGNFMGSLGVGQSLGVHGDLGVQGNVYFASEVGIGTTTPSYPLTIITSSTDRGLAVYNSAGLPLLRVASSTLTAINDLGHPNTMSGLAVLDLGSTDGFVGALRINNDGGIIFTNSSNETVADFNSRGLALTDGSGSNTTTYAYDNITFNRTALNPNGVFSVNSSGNIVTSGTIKTYGSAAFGTTTALSWLSVQGGNAANAVHIGDVGYTNYAGIALNGSLNGTDYTLLSGLDDKTLYINRQTGGSIRFRENNVDQLIIASTTGYVGIGTSTPQAKLHVADGTLLVDTPNPTLATSTNNTTSSKAIYIYDKYAFIAGNFLRILDITDPLNPVAISETTLLTNSSAIDIKVVGGLLYISYGGPPYFSIYDISNLSSPVLLSSVGGGSAHEYLAIQGRYAYLTRPFTGTGLFIEDISNPHSITIVTSTNIVSSSLGVAVKGRYVYTIGSSPNNFAIIDVADPTTPVLAGNLAQGITPTSLAISGNYAYITDSTRLFVVNIANPSTPVTISTTTVGSTVRSITLAGKYAYLTSASEIKVVDISNPNTPIVVGSGSGLSSGRELALYGNYAVVADDNVSSGYKVFNVKGANISTALIGSASVSQLTVWENADFRSLNVQNTLNVGGIYSYGTVSGYVSSTPLSTASNNLAAAHFSSGGPSTTVMILDRKTTDGTLVSLRQNGTEEGSITVSANTVSYNAFTGSHYAALPIGVTDMTKGTLVTLTGANSSFNNRTSSEVIYGVTSTARANDSRVLGSYLALQNGSGYGTDNPHLVMAVGNGEMWVADNGSNIEAGDYLISSDVPGHAMKDSEMFDKSYIVARAAVDVDWDTVTETVTSTDGLVVKHAKISVFYENFVKDNRLDKSLTINTSSTTITLGTASTSFALRLRDAITFTSSSVLTTLAPEYSGARAFVLNAVNYNGYEDSNLFSLQTGGVSQFVVKGNGNVFTNGTVRAASFETGTSTLDLAETYPIHPACEADGTCPEAGDAVCVVEGSVATIEKCTLAYSEKAIGIISTNPGFTLGGKGTDRERKVALAGRVPLKISTKNGNIEVGDKLTTSDIPGVAMKATEAGPTIGVALEAFSGGEGSVLAFVRMGWYSPLAVSAPISAGVWSTESIFTAVIEGLKNIGITVAQGVIKATEFIAGTITSDSVNTQKLCVDSTCITKDQFKQLLDKNNITPEATSTPQVDPLNPPGEVMPTDTPSSTAETVSSTPVASDSQTSSTTPGGVTTSLPTAPSTSDTTTTQTSSEPQPSTPPPSNSATEPPPAVSEPAPTTEVTSPATNQTAPAEGSTVPSTSESASTPSTPVTSEPTPSSNTSGSAPATETAASTSPTPAPSTSEPAPSV